MSTNSEMQQKLEQFRRDFKALQLEIGKRIVGQKDVVEAALGALVVGGHVLLEGLPGMGKTQLVRSLAEVVELTFQRIQCTPDLMPADVIGTYVVMETPQGRRTFEFQRGPLFANIVLADQINRTTPKTQSALLEAMDEKSITVSTETFPLPEPYFVIATQNPLEMEGTYPLPEAQIDRFLFKLLVRPPDCDEIEQILDRTTEAGPPKIRAVADGRRIIEMGQLVRQIPIGHKVRRWGISLVAATQPDNERAPEMVRRFVRFGSSPRGAQALVLAAKVRAILDGRDQVSCADLRGACHAALRHRLILNFEGQAENIQPDDVIDSILQAIPEPTTTTEALPGEA